MQGFFKKAFLSAIAAALVFSFACSKKQESPRLEHNLLSFYTEKDASTSFYADDVKLDDRIGGAITTLGTVDGKEGFVVASSALYRINTEGLLKIYPAAVTNAVPALNGGKILFATATMVHLYDEAAKSYEKLEGVEAKSIIDLALSPNGETAGVTALQEGCIMSYLYSGGKVSEYGKDKCIVAVSDDAKIVYYLETIDTEVTGILHIVKNGKDSIITQNASTYFELNSDLSEITFDVDGKTHISRNGEAARKLADASIFSYSGAQRSSMGGKACVTLLKNTNTLLDGIFYSNIVGEDSDGNKHDMYDVYYVDGSLNCSALALGATQFSVSEDSKTILTIVDDALYRVSAYNPRSPEQLVQSIYMFSCDRELSDIHCLDVGGNVYRYENNKLSTILVTGVDVIKRTSDGGVICYSSLESDGTLFLLKGDRAAPVAVGVNFFEIYEHAIVYLANYDKTEQTYDLYISSDGENFRLAEQGVRI
ncbi:MAG: hypothetical protein IKZ82_02430 [Clostridia bacterium]|nr:hypothetical protein [Clostridia bacterium]